VKAGTGKVSDQVDTIDPDTEPVGEAKTPGTDKEKVTSNPSKGRSDPYNFMGQPLAIQWPELMNLIPHPHPW
jgi:hypothetical protein